jgi:thymidylate synthase (FAD)
MERKEIKVLDYGFVALVDHMGNDNSVVQAARVSYGKGTKTTTEDRNLIRYLMRNSHETPFEMTAIKFHVKAPIFVFRQWHRHRIGISINEMSGRYSEMPEEFYVPEIDCLNKQDKNIKQGRGQGQLENATTIQTRMKEQGQQEFQHYHWLLEQDVAREVARINLPLSTYSEMYWQVNLRSLFNFLLLRLDHHAQYEIRQFSEAMLELTKPLFPISCEAFIDYKMEAKTFSKMEIELLRKLDFNLFFEESNMTLREIKDFKNKLGIVDK